MCSFGHQKPDVSNQKKTESKFFLSMPVSHFFVNRLNNYLATKKDLDGTTIGQKTFDLRQTKMSEHQMSKDFLLTFKILSSTYAAADVIKQNCNKSPNLVSLAAINRFAKRLQTNGHSINRVTRSNCFPFEWSVAWILKHHSSNVTLSLTNESKVCLLLLWHLLPT